MRNLKRALSLALAMVMVLSMMVIGAGAAGYDDFSDKDEIVNKEAVQMLVELGVINGKDDGTYDPTGIVTRGEMAKIICVVLNKGQDPNLGTVASYTYTDTVGHWAAGYIEYCTQQGIVAGDGAGNFNPNATVTGSEAAKMLLVAMGYKSEVEGFTGANWAIAVNVRANQKGLYSDLSISVDAGLTRDSAAQMVYNALDAGIVSYEYTLITDGSTISSSPTLIDDNSKTLLEHAFNAVKVEGVVVANEYANLESSAEKGAALDAGETKLDVTNYGANEDQSVFGDGKYSVSTSLDMLGKSVTLYVKKDASSTSKATILGNAILSEDNVVVTTAAKKTIAKIASDNDLDVSGAKILVNYTNADYNKDDSVRGVEKVLIDNNDDGDVDYVLVNTWYFGQVSKYSTKDDGSITIASASVTPALTADDADDVVGFDDVAKDDYVLAAWIGGKLYVEQAESVTGVLEAYKSSEKMTVDGTEYDVSLVAGYTGGSDDIRAAETYASSTTLDNEATFYLDKNGMIVAVGNVAENAYNYAYIWAYEKGNIDSDRVKATLSDGTTKTFNLASNSKAPAAAAFSTDTTNDSTNSVSRLWAYSINSDGELRLTAAAAGAAATSFTKNNTSLGGGLYATNNTVFFYVSLKDNTSVIDSVSVYTGYKNAPSVDTIANGVSALGSNSTSRVVATAFVDANLNSTNVTEHLYVTGTVRMTSDYTTVKAILAGTDEEVEINVDPSTADNTVATGMYLYTVNSDGTYDLTAVTAVNTGNKYITVNGTASHVSDSTLVVSAGEFVVADKTVLIELEDGDFDNVITGRLPAADDNIVAILVDDTDNGSNLLMVIIDNGDATPVEPGEVNSNVTATFSLSDGLKFSCTNGYVPSDAEKIAAAKAAVAKALDVNASDVTVSVAGKSWTVEASGSKWTGEPTTNTVAVTTADKNTHLAYTSNWKDDETYGWAYELVNSGYVTFDTTITATDTDAITVSGKVIGTDVETTVPGFGGEEDTIKSLYCTGGTATAQNNLADSTEFAIIALYDAAAGGSAKYVLVGNDGPADTTVTVGSTQYTITWDLTF